MNEIEPGTYRHFTGALCQVVGVAVHSGSMERLVICQVPWGGDVPEAIPVAKFIESVDHNGKRVKRFEKV